MSCSMINRRFSLSDKLRLFNKSGVNTSARNDWLIDEGELESQLFKQDEKGAFLGILSQEEVFGLFESCGVQAALARRGFRDVLSEMKTDDPSLHRFRICSQDGSEEGLLVEIVLRKASIPNHKFVLSLDSMPKLDFLFVEWLLSQNPQEGFTAAKSCLPGQRHPGLGIARNLLEVLVNFAEKLNVFGIATVPGHYHNAVIFSEYLKYLDPVSEGRLAALQRDLAGFSLADVSWAIDLGCVQDDKSGQDVKWFLDWQIYPTRPAMEGYFNSKVYLDRKLAASDACQFYLDEQKFKHEGERIPRMMADLI